MKSNLHVLVCRFFCLFLLLLILYLSTSQWIILYVDLIFRVRLPVNIFIFSRCIIILTIIPSILLVWSFHSCCYISFSTIVHLLFRLMIESVTVSLIYSTNIFIYLHFKLRLSTFFLSLTKLRELIQYHQLILKNCYICYSIELHIYVHYGSSRLWN